MKKFFSVTAIVGVMIAVAIGASAAPNTVPNDMGDPPAVTGHKKGAIKDRRVINPSMNYRQRVEMQNAIQKRAMAKRNSLLRAAMKDGQQEQKTTNGQTPVVTP